MNTIRNTIRNNWKLMLACAVLGALAGCYTAKQQTGIYYPVDMVWWPDAQPTKLTETEPGTYAQNQVVRAGEEFPEQYLNAQK